MAQTSRQTGARTHLKKDLTAFGSTLTGSKLTSRPQIRSVSGISLVLLPLVVEEVDPI
jgi:hypothetical protein